MYRVRQCNDEITKMIKEYEEFCRKIGLKSSSCNGEKVQHSFFDVSSLENAIVTKKNMEAEIDAKLVELDKLKDELTEIIFNQDKISGRKKMILYMFFVDGMTNSQIARFFNITERTVILEKNEAVKELTSPPYVIK